MLVAGPTSSGKSIFVANLLHGRDLLFRNSPSRVIWCYAVWQPLYDELRGNLTCIEFHEGLPELDLIKQGTFILVVDDLMSEAQASDRLTQIFTKYSHHYNVSSIYLLQNLFPKGVQ